MLWSIVPLQNLPVSLIAGPEIAWDSGKKGQLAQWDGLRQSDVLEQLTSQDRLGGGSVSMLLYMPIATLDP